MFCALRYLRWPAFAFWTRHCTGTITRELLTARKLLPSEPVTVRPGLAGSTIEWRTWRLVGGLGDAGAGCDQRERGGGGGAGRDATAREWG